MRIRASLLAPRVMMPHQISDNQRTRIRITATADGYEGCKTLSKMIHSSNKKR